LLKQEDKGMNSSRQYMVTLVTLLICFTTIISGQNTVNIIPLPAEIMNRTGSLKIENSCYLFSNYPELNVGFQIFQEQLQSTTNIKCTSTQDEAMANIIITKADELHPGQYQLDITQQKIRIRAKDAQGVFYATQTLMQICPPSIYGSINTKESKLKLPCLWINDYPRFEYRGMHLDVCRHFFSADFIKKYIDFIAMHKMNYFHWHLTEDQGWRIEIKKYPKLTQVGSSRKETLIGSYNDLPHKYDNKEYKGFYTQDEIKDIVEYAAKRFVTIIPEIEMPGHALAAIASYPELSCQSKPVDVATTWGVFEDVFCPKESTFEFLENVLTEVMDLFPGEYIHIGGDECPKERWKSCSNCKALMLNQGLKTEEELQSYFIHRIEKFINKRGKKIIGWDEILEGGLAPNATVMSWRGTKGGIEAAKEHHNVVMTPGSHCYFDHYQSLSLDEPIAIGGFTSVMKVYDFEPIPSELKGEERKYIIGAQGNVWTEYILNEAHVEYMALPRMSALSEVVWSPESARNKEDFKKRLSEHLLRLKSRNVNFATHIFDPEIKTRPTENGHLEISLIASKPNDVIRYAIDHEPTDSDQKYEKPVIMSSSGRFYCRSTGEVKGTLLSINFEKSNSFGKNITLKDQPSEKYPGSEGPNTLVDGLRGGKRFNGLNWLGFGGKDLEAVVDLGKIQQVGDVAVGSINNVGAWIHAPKKLIIYLSKDGVDYNLASDKKAELDENNLIHSNPINTEARFIKVILENQGVIPEGNPGAGNKAWLFVDEILIR
jgi:hexosaminidase